MKSVHFKWQGADTTWFDFWLGNGLCVSAFMVSTIVALWVLGGLDSTQRSALVPLAWAAFASLALTSLLGFRYFGPRPGVVFGVIAIMTGIAIVVA